MKSLVLLVICLHIASGALHSWKAYYTGTTGLSQFPEFVALNLIDDQLMGYFDSKSNRFKSQFKWMEDNLGKNYDEQETNTLLGQAATFKNNVKVAMDRFNQTQGVHTLQVMYGCEIDDDGTKRGYEQHGFDGEDFISLDESSLTWTAANPQAMITKNKLDANRAFAEQEKAYLENTCIEWLQKYVGYGKSTLERKVSPQVSLLKKSSSSQVSCHATGFHPKEVTISWQKNGHDHDEDVDLGELLPNEDGTFQKTSTLRVSPDELKKNEYSCVVEHQGKTIREILTEGSLPIGIIVGVVVGVLLLLAVIGVAVFKVLQKKKKTDFKPVSGSDDGSNNS